MLERAKRPQIFHACTGERKFGDGVIFDGVFLFAVEFGIQLTHLRHDSIDAIERRQFLRAANEIAPVARVREIDAAHWNRWALQAFSISESRRDEESREERHRIAPA